MDKRADTILGAASAFEADSVRGIGVDEVLALSGASTRTLYKHFGSKEESVFAVLKDRHRHFAERLDATARAAGAVAALFETLWH
jgi:AcrR family transcriptional regulator